MDKALCKCGIIIIYSSSPGRSHDRPVFGVSLYQLVQAIKGEAKGGIVMLEFMMMMAVMALAFCAATVFVSLIAGGILKVTQTLKRKRA